MKPVIKKKENKPTFDKITLDKYIIENKDIFTELVPNILYIETNLNNYLKAISPSLYDKFLRFAISINEIAVFAFDVENDTTAKINYLHLDGSPIQSLKSETVYYNGRIKQFKAIVYESVFISITGFHETKYLIEFEKVADEKNHGL